MGQVKELIDKLQTLGIIKQPNYDENLSVQAMLDKINSVNPERLHFFTTDKIEQFKPSSQNERQKEKFNDADLYVVTSAPVFASESEAYHLLNRVYGIGLGAPSKTIFCLDMVDQHLVLNKEGWMLQYALELILGLSMKKGMCSIQ